MDRIMAKVRALRAESGLSQRELAEKLGVDLKTYSNWERGKVKTTFDMIARIAEALGKPTEDIWDPKNFKRNNPPEGADLSSIIHAESEPVYSSQTLEDCQRYIKALLNEISQLKATNLALTRSLNNLYKE